MPVLLQLSENKGMGKIDQALEEVLEGLENISCPKLDIYMDSLQGVDKAIFDGKLIGLRVPRH